MHRDFRAADEAYSAVAVDKLVVSSEPGTDYCFGVSSGK